LLACMAISQTGQRRILGCWPGLIENKWPKRETQN